MQTTKGNSELVAETRASDCPDHGAYESRRIGRWGGWTMCPRCLQDLEREEGATLSQRKKDLAAERILARLRASGVPDRFADRTLDSYRAESDAQRKALAFAVRYAEEWDDVRATGRSAIWVGRPGTGKTHLAIGVCLRLLDRDETVIYTTVQRAIRRVRDTWDRDRKVETESQAIDALAKAGLLVLDEVGVQAGSANEQNILFDILNERYNGRRPTLMLSNMAKAQVVEVLGERIVDRLREDGGAVVAFDWDSYRRGGRVAQ